MLCFGATHQSSYTSDSSDSKGAVLSKMRYSYIYITNIDVLEGYNFITFNDMWRPEASDTPRASYRQL